MPHGDAVSAHWVARGAFFALLAGRVADGRGMATTAAGLVLWVFGKSYLVLYTFKLVALYGVCGWFEGQADVVVLVIVDVWKWYNNR